MKNEIEKLIENVILDCESDDRISSGVFDIHNADHLAVFVERSVRFGLTEEIAENLLDTAMFAEGKHPDRQAYNKEGWLVTFPSKEYRDAAIKKGTHAISDPTHGKGGMNLYYKRKGKQKRQTAQATTSVDQQVNTGQTVKQPASVAQPINQKTAQTGTPSDVPKDSKPKSQAPEEDLDVDSRSDALLKYAAKKLGPTYKGKYSQEPSSEAPAAPAAPASAEAPAIDVPVVTTPPEQYSSVSKKFADKKGWKSEPYGEYRDAEGSTVAVVGLSGEVVPIKSVDRDEYKIFAEKNMT
jgi:hypothetical protein